MIDPQRIATIDDRRHGDLKHRSPCGGLVYESHLSFGRHRLPLPCLDLPSRRSGRASEAGVSKAAANDASQYEHESVGVFARPLVEPKCLLIDVAVQVIGLYADVGAPDRPLEQGPKVFKSIGVDGSTPTTWTLGRRSIHSGRISSREINQCMSEVVQ